MKYLGGWRYRHRSRFSQTIRVDDETLSLFLEEKKSERTRDVASAKTELENPGRNAQSYANEAGDLRSGVPRAYLSRCRSPSRVDATRRDATRDWQNEIRPLTGHRDKPSLLLVPVRF